MLAAIFPHVAKAKIATAFGMTECQINNQANLLKLKKTSAYMVKLAAETNAKLTESGKAHRFHKGQVPPNKGKKGMPSIGRMAETQFRKGSKPQTWRPIGTERYSKEGYLQVKIFETGVTRRDYVPVHILVWELHRGAVPSKTHVSFKDGDRTHIEIDNLELVSFADMMRRNTVHRLPPELKELIMLRGCVRATITKRLKKEASHGS